MRSLMKKKLQSPNSKVQQLGEYQHSRQPILQMLKFWTCSIVLLFSWDHNLCREVNVYFEWNIRCHTILCSFYQTWFAPYELPNRTGSLPFWLNISETISSGAISRNPAGYHGSNSCKSHKNIQPNSTRKINMVCSPILENTTSPKFRNEFLYNKQIF